MRRKNKLKSIFTYLPIIGGIILILISVYSSYKDNSILGVVGGVLLIIIPYIYSILPIMKERNEKNSNSMNRISENTFTDRHKDLQELIKLLNEHKIIQLTGNDSKCGKSWLAFKLIDYIKHPKDNEFKSYSSLNNHIKNVYYIDMKNKSDIDINLFFENNIINSKTLIIADHIHKLDTIFSKQDIYKFSLIFITSSCIRTKGIIYYISDFERDNIPILQDNINQNYSKIDILNKLEIEVLYDLTFGNIGKIHFLLERQEYVDWIKQIAHNQQTSYDNELNKIQIELFKGNYFSAEVKLDIFEIKYKIELYNNNDLYFKYYIMRSDCEHLLNNYQKALELLLVLKSKELNVYNIKNKVEILEAHYYKHLWKCDDALILLQKIQSFNICGLTDSLGILVAKYFVDDLSVPFSGSNSLKVFFKSFEMCQKSSLEKSDRDIFKIKRNESIYLYYKNIYKNIYKKDEILLPINEVIYKYKLENNRLLANAYFIRAELNRLFKKYKSALSDYNNCISITDDNNIKIQVNIMKYYLAKIKKIPVFKTDITKDQIYELCKNKNNYGLLLIRRINSIELNDPDKKQIINCFDHRIMTIL